MYPDLGEDRSIRQPGRDYLLYAFLLFAGAAFSLTAMPLGFALLSSAWWGIVLIIIRTDLGTLTIPDEASLAVAAMGLIDVYLRQDGGSLISDTTTGLTRGFVAFSLFYLVKVAYRSLRGQEGLGFGDVKLAGACAIWLYPDEQIIALEIAAGSALALVLFKRARVQATLIPFGAFLAPAAWLVFVSRSWLGMR
jgi:prepilin signal peptidase PulO-like enzyme (type II secretory pathway)